MIYCPYTDKDIPENQANSEHIIPLALGGLNGFEIMVDAEYQSKLGSDIDGKLANDFLVQFKRRDAYSRGHSGKECVPISKKATLGDSKRPVRAEFAKGGLQFWDPREKRYLTGSEFGGQVLTATVKINTEVRLRFVAKTALSSGYFLFDEIFRNHVAHKGLRLLMNCGPSSPPKNAKSLSIRLYDQFSPLPEKDREKAGFFQLLHAVAGGSSVHFGYGPANLVISVGILGQFIGMVNVAADIDQFPNDADYHLGHVVFLQNGQIQRGSLYSAVELLRSHAIDKKSP